MVYASTSALYPTGIGKSGVLNPGMALMSNPIPRDPRSLGVTPEELNQSIEEILAEPAEDLAAEAEQLNQAHELLRAALQEN